MENSREQSGEEAPMYSDSYLLPILQELHKRPYEPVGTKPPLVTFVEDLIERATGNIEQGSKDALLEDRKGTDEIPNLEFHYHKLPSIIGSLSSQMTSDILHGNDTHSITLNVLRHLSEFKWNDKVGLTLAAFALTFGDLWLLVRIYAHNVVNEPVTTDQRELTSTNKEAYRNQIEGNNEFIKSLVNAFQHLYHVKVYIIDAVNRGPIYVYWLVRCAIAAATHIIVLSSRGLDQFLVGIRTPTEVEKLISRIRDLIDEFSKIKESEKVAETYYKVLSFPVDDIIEFMRNIITDKDMPPLYHSVSKRKDHLDVLRGKRVLLLISEIDMFSEDITSLKHVSIDTRQDEIVWIPVINRSIAELDPVKNQLETLQNLMPWYSVQPSMVTDVVIDYFKLEWVIKPKTLLYLLSPSGKVLRYNAMDMVRIWPNISVDNLITRDMERQLWKKETWNLKLLVNDIIIDPIMQKWIRDERYILMYGGNDIDWIRRFTRQANSIASDLYACIEMVYVGNMHNKDLGCGVQKVILIEQLSHCLPESNMAYFWTRIDTMIESMKMWYPTNPLREKMLRFRSHEPMKNGLYLREDQQS